MKHVFGQTVPVDIHELPSLSNKIILGDWAWHPNRKLAMPESRGHSQDARKYNMLFGDGHSELFDFGLDYESVPFWLTPDPKSKFW